MYAPIAKDLQQKELQLEFGTVKNARLNLQAEHTFLKRDSMYMCLNCGKKIDAKEVKDKIRCPYCGYRTIVKETPKTVKKVSAD